MSAELLLIERDIHLALCRFTRACDERDWAAFETVFAPDITMEFPGFFAVTGRDAIIANIRAHLGGCGPSQHLIGNLVVAVAGETAQSRCYIRAFHRGRGDAAHITFEALGEYGVRWQHLAEGWRAVTWMMTVQTELGSREILQAEVA